MFLPGAVLCLALRRLIGTSGRGIGANPARSPRPTSSPFSWSKRDGAAEPKEAAEWLARSLLHGSFNRLLSQRWTPNFPLWSRQLCMSRLVPRRTMAVPQTRIYFTAYLGSMPRRHLRCRCCAAACVKFIPQSSMSRRNRNSSICPWLTWYNLIQHSSLNFLA